MDPVDQYLEQTAKSSVMLPSCQQKQHSWMPCNMRGKELREGGGSDRAGPSSSHQNASSSLPSTSNKVRLFTVASVINLYLVGYYFFDAWEAL